MFVTVGNFKLLKAEEGESDKTIRVKIIANNLTLDTKDEQILPEAFDEGTVKEFLDIGIIDWHHQSILGKSSKERAAAIIGKPIAFQWENGLPVVVADLPKSHPIVKNSIIPNLEAGLPVFAASVGGKTKEVAPSFDHSTGRMKNNISKIFWNHLAITGAPYVINTAPGTQVSLVKAAFSGEEERTEELAVHFRDISYLTAQADILNRETELRKALEAGTETDSAEKTGMDALQKQSLEDKPANNRPDTTGPHGRGQGPGAGKADGSGWKHPLKDQVIYGILNGDIPGNSKGVRAFLESKNQLESEIKRFLREFDTAIKRAIKNL